MKLFVKKQFGNQVHQIRNYQSCLISNTGSGSTPSNAHHHTIKGAEHKDHMIKNLITFNPSYHGSKTQEQDSDKLRSVDLSTVYEFAKQPASSISLKVLFLFDEMIFNTFR